MDGSEHATGNRNEHEDEHEARGPGDLLIAAVPWDGLKMGKDFKTWQYQEEPIDVSQLPYQSLQP